MFKIKENDIFAKNMSSQELHQTWVKIKENQVTDNILNKLKVQLDKKYKLVIK